MTQKHTETAFRHAVAWTVAVTVALGVIKMLWPGHAGTLSALLLITVLFVKAHRHRVTLEIYGWHIREWSADIRTFLILCCTTLPLYILVYHLVMACRGMYLSAGNLQNILAGMKSYDLWVWSVRMPILLGLLIQHLLCIAIPEEMFYRGFLQEAIHRENGLPSKRLWGGRLDKSVVYASAFFALGHFIGDWRPERLLTFFPGVAFGWAQSRTRTVVGAVLYHAFCNIFHAMLRTAYS